MSKRPRRKREHLILALQGSRCSFANYYDDIMLLHNALTTVNPGDVNLQVQLCGHKLAVPFYINALTGGTLWAKSINRALAVAARVFQVPMAVGSQSMAFSSIRAQESYTVVRKSYPQGILMANVSASIEPRLANRAVQMLEAQFLQLHLNSAQEFIMPEGDKILSRLEDNIAEICSLSPVPVLVKEVGFGILPTHVRKLATLGVKAVDISGRGGTNFAAIEGRRNLSQWWLPLADWGQPAPMCVALAGRAAIPDISLVASGGVDDGLKMLKMFALGADCCAAAGLFLRAQLRQGQDLVACLGDVLAQLRTGTALLGLSRVQDIAVKNVCITGRLAELIEAARDK